MNDLKPQGLSFVDPKDLSVENLRRMESIKQRADFLKQNGSDWLPRKKRRRLMRKTHVKLGRNDVCPCGSVKEDGKTRNKFKKCCLVKLSTASPLVLDSGFGITA